MFGARRLFVVDQDGEIRIVQHGKLLAKPFADLRSVVTSGGEQGLLSVAFHPGFAKNGRLFVYYTAKNQHEQVWELRELLERQVEHWLTETGFEDISITISGSALGATAPASHLAWILSSSPRSSQTPRQVGHGRAVST